MAQTLTITVRQRIGGQVSPFSAPVVVTVGGQAESPTGGAAAGMSDAERLAGSEAPLGGAGAGDQLGGVAVLKDAPGQGGGAGTSEADSVQSGGTHSYPETVADGAAAGTAAAGAASSSDARADGAAAGTTGADTYTAGGGLTTLSDSFTGANGSTPSASVWKAVVNALPGNTTVAPSVTIQSNRLHFFLDFFDDGVDPIETSEVYLPSKTLSRSGADRTIVITPVAATGDGQVTLIISAGSHYVWLLLNTAGNRAWLGHDGASDASNVTVPTLGQMKFVYKANGDIQAYIGATLVGTVAGTAWGDSYEVRIDGKNTSTASTVDVDDFSVT